MSGVRGCRAIGGRHDWRRVDVEVDGRRAYRYKCSICGEWWVTNLSGEPKIETWFYDDVGGASQFPTKRGSVARPRG